MKSVLERIDIEQGRLSETKENQDTAFFSSFFFFLLNFVLVAWFWLSQISQEEWEEKWINKHMNNFAPNSLPNRSKNNILEPRWVCHRRKRAPHRRARGGVKKRREYHMAVTGGVGSPWLLEKDERCFLRLGISILGVWVLIDEIEKRNWKTKGEWEEASYVALTWLPSQNWRQGPNMQRAKMLGTKI